MLAEKQYHMLMDPIISFCTRYIFEIRILHTLTNFTNIDELLSIVVTFVSLIQLIPH